MPLRRLFLASFCLFTAILSTRPAPGQGIFDPIQTEGVPPVPSELDESIDRYRFTESASLQGWLAGTRRLLYLSEWGGIHQAFLCERPGDRLRQVTSSGRPVARVDPHPHRERLIVSADDGGNEKHELSFHDMATGRFRRFASGRWDNESALWSRSGHLLAMTSNARNGKDRDLYVINPPYTATGRRLMKVDGSVYAQSWSPDDRRLAAVEWPPGLKTPRVHLIDVKTGRVETLAQPPGGPVVRDRVRWSPDGRSLYWLTDRDSDFLHLARYELSTGTETPLSDKIPWDIDRYALSDDGTTAVLVANEDGRTRLHLIDPRTGRVRPAPRLAEGTIGRVSFRRTSLEFAFEWCSARSPNGLFSYDLASRWETQWLKPLAVSTESRGVPGHEPFRYQSFDGRLIPAFIRHPGPRFSGPRPVVVIIHGGPAAQYRPGFSLLENYLLGELGVALVMPNVRGSTGYGRSFEKLDDGRRREDAVRDIGSLLDWISTQPDLDASRVAVSGSSHGGYLALAALVQYGDRLRAGIDIAGFSDFESSLKNEPASAIDYWRDEYGDERDPETLKFLHSISPLTHADRIRQPLLIAHGETDRRVQVGEADQFVSALRGQGTTVWSIRFPGEGHNLERREDAVYLMHAQILFLKRFLLNSW